MSLSLLDWRRRVFALYAEVRAAGDPGSAHDHWRRGRDELFATHPESPLQPAAKASFVGLPVAPYDPHLRFEVALDTDMEPEELAVPTGTDGLVVFRRAGRLALPIGNLDVWRLTSYGGGLFVPIKDAGAGTTYGGGRYLLDTVKGADLGGQFDPATGAGTLVVDLNFAYSPSCAYDPAWACPLAPPGNVVGPQVAAGELMPAIPWYAA